MQKLKEKRAAVKAEMDAILTDAGEGNLTEEAQVQWDEKQAEYNSLTDKIEKQDWLNEQQAELDKVDVVAHKPQPQNTDNINVVGISASQLNAFDDPKDALKCGKWMQAELFNDKKAQDWCNQHGVYATTMVGSTDNIGGATVPDIMSATVLKLIKDYGVFPKYARNIPMGSDTVTVPQNTGGIAVTIEGQGDAIAEDNSTWAKVTLTAQKAACLTRMSSELVEDAIISIVDDLIDDHARAHALKIDTDGFGAITTGLAAGSYATCAGSLVSTATGETSASDITMAHLLELFGKLPNFTGIQPCWYCSKPMYASVIARLQMAAGGNTTQDFGSGPQLAFMGYPVVIVDALNATITAEPTSIKILFGDLRLGCMYGSRTGLTIKQSSDRYFDTDEIAIKTTMRRVAIAHSLGNSLTAGPIVALKTGAAST